MNAGGTRQEIFVLRSRPIGQRWPLVLAIVLVSLVVMGLSGMVAKTVFDQQWGFDLAGLSVVFLVPTTRFGTQPLAHWWVCESRFDATSGDLTCWHQAGPVRGPRRRFVQGSELVLRVSSFSSRADLSLRAGFRRMLIGDASQVEPNDYRAFVSWLRANGWVLNDTAVLDRQPRLRPALTVGEQWVTLPRGGSSKRSPWLLPYGPAEAGEASHPAEPWLPADNSHNVGEVDFDLSPGQARSIMIRIGIPPNGARLADFGGWATGVSIARGRRFDDIECDVPVEGAAWILAGDRLEITLVEAVPIEVLP